MKVDVVDHPESNRFEADVNGETAVAEYRMDGDRIVLTHTEVPLHMRGQGIAEAMARVALESARSRNLKVVPACQFMASFIRKHPEYQDLVSEQ